MVTEGALLGLLTAEQGPSQPWAHTRAPEAPGAVAGDATSRGQPVVTGVRGPQQQALLTPRPPPLRCREPSGIQAEGKPVRGDTGLESTQQAARGSVIPGPPRFSSLGSAVGGRSAMTLAWNLQILRRRPGGVSTRPWDRG